MIAYERNDRVANKTCFTLSFCAMGWSGVFRVLPVEMEGKKDEDGET